MILTAAHDLFVERGYMGTTLRDVAAQAGISERTVYLAFGSKGRLPLAVIYGAIGGDAATVPVAQRDWFQAMLEMPDARQQIHAFASVVRQIHERTATLITVLCSAAASEPRVAELWRTHAHGQEEDERLFVESLHAKGALRTDLTPAGALETVWALTTPIFYAQCHEHGWSPEGYEAWLADTLARLPLD